MRNPDRRSPLAALFGASLTRVWRGASGGASGWTRALAGGALAAAAFILATEEYWIAGALVTACFAGLAVALFALTRRAGVALALVVSLMAALYAASGFKFRIVAMNLHVYDAAFYLFNMAQASFFVETFPLEAGALAAGALACMALLVVAWRRERPRLPGRLLTAGLLVAGLGAGAGASSALIQRGAPIFNEGENVFSAFIASFGDLPALAQARGFLEMSAQASLAPGVPEPIVCEPAQTPPDIVLFLNESAMPPGVYPQLAYPPEALPLFQSQDGGVRRLRVETFGGGTWLSDFSALTGLSTNMFGSMRNFAAQLTAGRLRHTLPQYLKACGYETTIIYPSLAEFAGSARFYRAIGFDRVIDRKTHKAPDERQRDAFYYAQVRKVFDDARQRESRRPQFVVASSMSTHSPWDFRFAPDQLRPGEATRWTGNAEFDEYLWRLVLARRDRDAFRADLARSFPGKPFLFVGYGDHQPALARLPLENASEIADRGAAWQLDPASRAFETYYSVEGLGFAPRAAASDLPILEIPHLATVTVAAAGLPLDAVFARRLRLLETCKGLYTTCPDKGAVLGFQRWLVDHGWMSAQR
jgi:hypothetical protein